LQDAEYRWTLAKPPEIRVEFKPVKWMDCKSFESSLSGLKVLLSSDTFEITFIIPEKCSILLDAAGRFLALCNQLIDAGKAVSIDFNDCQSTLYYFNRIGFIDHLHKNVTVLPARCIGYYNSGKKSLNEGNTLPPQPTRRKCYETRQAFQSGTEAGGIGKRQGHRDQRGGGDGGSPLHDDI
jgi:hypothetical protein